MARVVDGDTILAEEIVLHYGVSLTHKYIRLKGVRAPERNTPEGQRATEKLRSLLREGKIFLSVPEDREIDRYNRLIGVLYLKDQDGYRNLNQAMREYLNEAD